MNFLYLSVKSHLIACCVGSEKGIVAGLEQAIGTMKMKESARIIVKPQYAYGEEGNNELGIPGGAELTYDVRVNNFTKVSGVCIEAGMPFNACFPLPSL